MKLLNSEELKNLKGGTVFTDLAAKCDKKDDVIYCAEGKMIACADFEVKCPSTFSSKCGLIYGGITISGCPDITINPI
ncbi:MAG: hypothetical protein LBT27_08830 [Prevotellaceae bacterium]|jgi:hypothetical protein|nr:hypothetical protein [Prevotellaceae bacterium]